jgi:Domain of unknown function (DUF4864)
MEDLPDIPRPGAPESDPSPVSDSSAKIVAEWFPPLEYAALAPVLSSRRDFRRRLLLVFSLGLAAFGLTAWILARLEPSFAGFADGPSEVVRAQLRALGRGDLRGAYGMFSVRYRQQVSFDAWHELVVTHWRMFHAEVMSGSEPARSRGEITLVMHLRGADDKTYRARFTLIQWQGRWWVDDLHWGEEPDEHDLLQT